MATFASVLPVLATALWLHLHWAQIPERWPRHWDMDGVANGFGARSAGSVYGPCVLGLLSAVLFATMVAFLARASGTGATQRSRSLAPLAVLGWLIVGATCWAALLPLQTQITEHSVTVTLVSYSLVLFTVVGWLMYRMGTFHTVHTLDIRDGTPDSHWYGGILYYNPGDAAVLVPKRHGWGWTLNFARPVTWVFTAAILGFALLSIWLPRLLR